MVKYKEDDECLPVVVEDFVEFFQATPDFHYHQFTKSFLILFVDDLCFCVLFCEMINFDAI